MQVPRHVFAEERVLYGSWWSHVTSWHSASLARSNLLFLTYEELQEDLVGRVRQIAAFLDKPLEEGTAENIAAACSFSSMKSNRGSSMAYCKNFWRRGVCGDHVNHLSQDQLALFTHKNEKLLPAQLRERLHFHGKEGEDTN